MKNNSASPSPNGKIGLTIEAPIRVLCVDDETSFLNSTKQILELQGSFHVKLASSVMEALQKMGDEVFDVIVSDYQMPEKDGLDFLRELREGGNEVPFILFTGKGREEVAVNALNLGANRYFNKFGHPETVYGELAHGILQVVDKQRSKLMLSESEERFRLYVENSPVAVFVANPQAEYEYVNSAACKLLGHSNKELLKMSIPQIAVEQDSTKVPRSFAELKMRGRLSREVKLRHKTGKPVYVNLNAVKLPNGKLIAFCEDITEQKKAEETLEKERHKLDCIIDSSPIIIFYKDNEGKFLRVNNTFAQALNLSKEEFLGKTVLDLYSPDIAQNMTKDDLEVLESKRPKLGIKEQYESANGIRWVQTDKVPIVNESGNVDGLVGFAQDITDRKKAEDALRESEKRFRELSDLLPEVVFEIDERGFIDFQNQEAYAKFGYSKEDVEKGKTVFQMLVPEDRDKAKEISDRLLRGEETGLVEYTALRKDGSTFPIITNSAPIIRDNKVVGIRGVAVDITEHKNAEEALRDSEKRFRELSELLPEVIFETDGRGMLQFVNHTAYTRFGYSREEFDNGLHALQTLVPEDRDRAKENIGKVLRGERTETNEYTAMRKDGSTFQIIINSTPIVHGDEIVGLRGVMVDITALKKAEDTLRESEEKFRNLAEQSPNMIFINQEGRTVYVNRRGEEVLGYTREELCSPDFSHLTLVSPESMEIMRSVMPKHEKGEEVPPFEYSLMTRKGKRVEAILTTKLIQYKGNSAILGTITDITERKKAEDALRETLTTMEALNEKLRVIGKLTRHDARNKLSTITNNAYLAKIQLDDNHPALTHLNDIEVSVDQIEKILEFSRIYEMLGTEELSYINVKISIEEAVMLLSCPDSIEFVNYCNGLTVRADSLLRQIFYNLIENSLKHGERVTKIKVYYTEEKDCLKLIYEDNGVGIPEAEKTKIFREGYGKGTGYGLYLIQKICEAYGWTIHETSTRREGAKFVMTLPKLNKNGKNSYVLKKV